MNVMDVDGIRREVASAVDLAAERIQCDKADDAFIAQTSRALSKGAREYVVRTFLVQAARDALRKETVAIEVAASRKVSTHFLADPRGLQAPLHDGKWAHGHVDSGLRGRYRSAAFNGCECEICVEYFRYCQTLDAGSSALETEANERIGDLIQSHASGIQIKWTVELLTSRFALNDGLLVAWGQATAEQHQQRIVMFRKNAVANIEGATRHQAAINALSIAGATCLNDLVSIEAAA